MFYQSTRNNKIMVSPSEAVIRGIADDGGLYMFSSNKDIGVDLEKIIKLNYFDMAKTILLKLLPDYTEEEMEKMVHDAYTDKFETDDITPTVKVGNKYVLELFRGPTSAFKDVALSMLPQLLTFAVRKNGTEDDIVILTATSGDTGKAALEGFKDVEGTKIIVFYPENGVSDVQKAQMITQEGKNVAVCAVKGNFDDAQTGVKIIFGNQDNEKLSETFGARLSSANSINIGRLAPQVVYYFKSYSDLALSGEITLGDKVNFCVPTGNFGDVLAGYIALLMGLPVGKLIVASNANNVLTDFFENGEYNKNRPFLKTISPSMDILISSNLERLLYLATDCNSEEVAGYMKDLSETGKYKVSEEVFSKIKSVFEAEFCDDSETVKTIGKYYNDYGYLVDTHTAVALASYDKYVEETGDNTPAVVLSTASPYKFCGAVARGIGLSEGETEFETMEKLFERTGVPVPAGLSGLNEKKVLHTKSIEKAEMEDYVLSKVSEKVWKN